VAATARWGHPLLLRPAGPDDGWFLQQMLVSAAFWRPGGPVLSVDEVLQRPELAHYVAGWPRPGDQGVIAQEAQPIGAAWLRRFSEDDPAFGFVDEQSPELAMAVVRQWRGRGVGAMLLREVTAQAAEAGVAGISLSVDLDNDAARLLYERFGFRGVRESDGSLTMLLRLSAG
jgi:ribosomal protein S18 acetylase RimI-like enzyme